MTPIKEVGHFHHLQPDYGFVRQDPGRSQPCGFAFGEVFVGAFCGSSGVGYFLLLEFIKWMICLFETKSETLF